MPQFLGKTQKTTMKTGGNFMENEAARSNFIWDAIDQDLAVGRYQRVHTRFPPEPNGYLHIGHCKALVADFR